MKRHAEDKKINTSTTHVMDADGVASMQGERGLLDQIITLLRDPRLLFSPHEFSVCVCAGTLKEVQWQDVQVGDIVKVTDGELIPADLLCLHTALDDGVCFIKTTNLDGESNLKIRRHAFIYLLSDPHPIVLALVAS
eukprot:scaffold409988_cov18-Prasinocladus_malaysianus.AAC.1